ncbi:hypothetical protein [Novosphingobium sp. KACC 22771]|uniref:hypothetical protein n=1 Tax=Novosphingobium sp. KACC 22771 TaxID=3025670 RepID=UPI0023674077|nr:hypothetical protein [Novosphingobium sp. KACC 22771]WDF74240.1 hypothetical protein PQ467_20000 [Novosphingobium sp. KACC 22771]
MTRRTPHCAGDHPNQLALDWTLDPEIEAMIEKRVLERAEAQALRWRLGLMAIETAVMGGLVIVAGLTLHQPVLETLRAGLLVAGACLAGSLLLIGLSAGCGALFSRFRQGRQK